MTIPNSFSPCPSCGGSEADCCERASAACIDYDKLTTNDSALRRERGMTDYTEDIPQSLAGAYNWLSHTPERRFQQARDDYAATLRSDFELFERAAALGETVHLLTAEFERYRGGLRKRWVAAIASDSRCASSFITGPSNFPARRMQKRQDIAARRWLEITEFQKRARAAILKTLDPARHGSQAIMSSDSDAVERLTAKVADLERMQAHMKAVNAAHARFLKDPASLDASDLDDVTKEEIRRYKPAYSWEPHPFPPYRLQNNSAEIRRAKDRLTKVTAAQSTPATTVDGANARVEDVPAENRVRLFYPGKPDEATRTELKRSGFRWTPTVGCWQAYRNAHTIEIAQRMAGVTCVS